MQHSIDRMIKALDERIAARKENNDKAHEKSIADQAAKRSKDEKQRKTAARSFREIADTIQDGSCVTKAQSEFLDKLRYGRYSSGDKYVVLSDLTTDHSKAPKRNDPFNETWPDDLKTVLIGLKRDNDGKTTVSTSFLKDLGYGTDVIKWVARI